MRSNRDQSIHFALLLLLIIINTILFIYFDKTMNTLFLGRDYSNEKT